MDRSAIFVVVLGAAAAAVALAVLPLADALAGIVLLAALMALSVIDIRTGLLPDALTLPLLLAGMLFAGFGIGPGLLASAMGAAGGWGGLALLAILYRRIRGVEGLGLGDAKLLGALGAWTGLIALPVIIFLASVFGLAFYASIRFRRGAFRIHDELPFGPFLALSGWCVFVTTRTEIVSLHLFSFVTQLS